MDREFLRETFLEIVENQLRADDPKETKQTFERLMEEGWSEEDAKKLIAQCVLTEIFMIQKYKKPFDEQRYIFNLKNLPDEPVEEIK